MEAESNSLQEELLKSKFMIVADRNERFAIIVNKLDQMAESIRRELTDPLNSPDATCQ